MEKSHQPFAPRGVIYTYKKSGALSVPARGSTTRSRTANRFRFNRTRVSRVTMIALIHACNPLLFFMVWRVWIMQWIYRYISIIPRTLVQSFHIWRMWAQGAHTKVGTIRVSIPDIRFQLRPKTVATFILPTIVYGIFSFVYTPIAYTSQGSGMPPQVSSEITISPISPTPTKLLTTLVTPSPTATPTSTPALAQPAKIVIDPLATFQPTTAVSPTKPVEVASVQSAPSAQFVRPAQGSITSYFATYHTAIDIANGDAPDVVAAQSGTVTYVGCITGGYGCYIEIGHADGYQTMYAHLSKFYVALGDQVRQGQAIGKMGATGRATGIHVHFEIKKDGIPQNPLNFI